MTILQTGLSNQGAAVPAGYQIERSLRFNSADSAHLTWTPPQAGNRQTWTFSAWVKRTALGTEQHIFSSTDSGDDNNYMTVSINTSNQIGVGFWSFAGIVTTQVFRDTSAFMHVVIVLDTTQATAANRLRLFINGLQVTAFSTDNRGSIAQNALLGMNRGGILHRIGQSGRSGADYFNGYLTEINFIDGQALTPSDFGETSASTGVWIPKAYTGSYGQNGFYLPFNDNSTVLNLGRNRQTLTADPYFPYTTLLLNGNGTNGAQNNTFIDSSTNNFTITRNGNTTQGTFSPFSQSGWSNYFASSSTDMLSTASNAAFAFGTGDFTMEAFVFATASQTDNWIIGLANNCWLRVGSGGALEFYNSVAASSVIAGSAMPTNQWVHVAAVRSGTTLTIYQNGISVASGTVSTNFSTSVACTIGNQSGVDRRWNGYLSNVRVVKGTAVYTSAFTPPTSALTAITNTSLLTCQNNRFIDNSANAFSLTVGGTPSVQAFSPFAPTAAYSAATNGGSGYFDGTGDYLTGPTNNAAFDITASDFCVEMWYYRTSSGAPQNLFSYRFTSGGTDDGWEWRVNSTNTMQLFYAGGSSITTTATVPVNAWTHLAVTRSGTTVRAFINGVLDSTATFSNSSASSPTFRVGVTNDNTGPVIGYISGARLVKGSAVYTAAFTPPTAPPTAITNTSLLLNFTNAGITDATAKNVLETVGNAQISTTQSKFGGSSLYSDGTGDRLVGPNSPVLNIQGGNWTIEAWVYAESTSGYRTIVTKRGGANFEWGIGVYNGSLYFFNGTLYTGGAVSTNTWTHVAAVRNGTTTTLYVNGVGTSIGNIDSGNPSTGNLIVFAEPGGTECWQGYIDDLRITKGIARYTGNFTPPTAQFAYNTADINVKQWVPNNFSVTAGVGNDSLVDSPTNYGTDTGAGGEVRGNYATLNPLDKGSTQSITDGNLRSQSSSSTTFTSTRGTIGVSSGKWYWEVTCTGISIASDQIGVANSSANIESYFSISAGGYGYAQSTGNKWNNNTGTAYGATYTTNDIIGVALDMDAGTLTFYKNGVSQGTAFTGLSGVMFPAIFVRDTSGSYYMNFGQRPFAYTAPSGFKALNTQNLPTPAIGASSTTLASQQMNIALWTGNGAASRAITGLGFSPDLVWYKSRSNAYSSRLFDSVRGANKELITNLTDAEATVTTELLSFDSDGFTIGSETATNGSGATFVGWAWRGSDSSAVSNTAGSITSTVSANQTAGISVVTYTGNGSTTGATVGHGLGVAPRLIIVKNRGRADDWLVQHASSGATGYLNLNGTGAFVSSARPWNNTAPTSSVFTVNTFAAENWTNRSADTYVAYCFAEIAGFSRFGSYTGNGSADGPFIFTGFRPRFVLIKSSSDGTASNDWAIIDAARNTFNESAKFLRPNLSAAEGDDAGTSPAISIDILSNGFKVRGTSARINTSSSTYIFAAFGESPFNYSRAR